MASGQYNYNVKVKASADKASFDSVKKSLEDVLSGISTGIEKAKKTGTSGLFTNDLKELQQMQNEVKEFQSIFNKSFNQNLGAINLVDFNNSLRSSQIDLQKVADAYSNMGAKGKQGFRELTAEILSTNRNLEKTTTFLDNMATTMGNTIKWGISSSVMNSFTGSIERAYGYVKNLDKSLNDIRIVSNKSADEMERFALQANKAAQALGATTLDYSNAALIYEQQGLQDAQVQERTNVTLKLSNVLGTSAEEVSNYMTAIWNNFDNGSHTLEYYADVLTELGAATASSAEEISTGLEKFAAIADTVGLSYEYATAALTTVTATTRQSAEVVGTAFKTLFARIQDLELGETLDDGTTLGKYSEALEKVGISIMDSNGELRDMDNILDDMGSKWDTLTKAQQVSLAQTVAGTRQYTQLVALMDNWDAFAKNLETASNATGSLDKQQAIYMDSVEAHLNTMDAAFENLYDSIFDEDTIKGFADAMTTVANSITALVDGLGGGGNTLLALGSIATTVFSKNIAQGLTSVISNMKVAKNNAAILNAELEIMEKFKGINVDDETTKSLIAMKEKVLEYGDLVTDAQQNELDGIINNTVKLQEEKEAWDNVLTSIEEYRDVLSSQSSFSNENLTAEEGEQIKGNLRANKVGEEGVTESSKETKANLEILQKNLMATQKNYEENILSAEKLNKKITDISLNSTTVAKKVEAIKEEFSTMSDITFTPSEQLFISNKTMKRFTDARDTFIELRDEIEELGGLNKVDDNSKVSAYLDSIYDMSEAYAEAEKEIVKGTKTMTYNIDQEINGMSKNIDENIGKNKETFKTFKEELDTSKAIASFTKLTGSIGQATSGISALINIFDIWNNQDLSAGEKAVQIMAALATGVPMVVSGFTGFVKSGAEIIKMLPQIGAKIIAIATARTAQATANTAATASTGALAAAEGVEAVAATAATGATMSLTAAVWALAWPILAVVAAIAVLAVGIYQVTKAYNEDAEAAAAAAEQAQAMTDRFNELDEAAKQLKTTISEYDEAITAMESLDKSTQEYADSLEKANEKAKELIETYGLYDQYEMKNGVITFKEGALDKVQAQADADARDAESRMYNAKIVSNQANLKSQTTNLSRDIGRDWGKTLLDYTFGTSIFGIGGMQAAIGNEENQRKMDNEEVTATAEAFNQLREKLGEEYDVVVQNEEALKRELLALEDLDPAIRKNIDLILENSDGFRELANSMNEATLANKFYTQQILENAISEKYGEQINAMATTGYDENGNAIVDEGRAAQITSILANSKEDTRKKMQEEIEAIDVDSEMSNADLRKYDKYKDVDNDEDLARAYARDVLGYSQEEVDKMSYQKGTGKGGLKTETGDVVLEDSNDERMRKALVENLKEQEIKDKYTNDLDSSGQLSSLNELVKGAKDAGDKYGTDFTDAVLNSFSSEDKKMDFSSLFADINPSEYAEMSALTDQEILDMFGMTDEKLQEAGYGSATEFAENFRAGLDGYKWDVDKALASAVSKEADDIEKYDLDSEDLTTYSKQLMEVSHNSEELSEDLQENADASVKVAKSVMRMNDGIEDLADGFEDWSDVIKNSSRTSEEYADALDNMKGTLSDILGTEKEFISESYVVDHMDEIEKAAEGDAEAIDRLKDALADEMILKFAAENDLDVNAQSTLLNKVNELQSMIPNIKVGTEIDVNDAQYADFFAKMQAIVTEAGLTAEQANALFGTMGFETEFVTESKPVKKTGHGTRTVTEFMGEEEVTMPDGTTMTIPSGWETKTYPGEAYEYVDYVDTIAMSTDGETPTIKSLTRTASGSMNNFSSANAGGGKAGGSKSKPKKEAKIQSNKDRYHDVNVELNLIGDSLDKLNKQKDKLFGSDLINNINQQIDLLNSQIETTNKKLEIAKGETSELQNKLSGQGVTFNADGTIANYAQAYEKQLAYVNSVIDKYNSLDAEGQEEYQETLDNAKENWEKFLEDIDRYDELVTDFMPELEADVQEAINQQIELQVEAFNMEMEIRLDLSEAEREWNDFKKRIIDGIDEDDILGNTKARLQDFSTYYNTEGTGSIQAGTGHVNDILAQLAQMDSTGWSDVYGDNRTQALEDLKTYYEQLMSDMTDLQDLSEEIHESYMDMMDEAQEKFDEQIEAYETIGSLIEHDMNVISLVYGEESYGALSQFYEKQEENNNKALDFQRQQVDFWRQQMDTLEEGSEEWEKAKENWLSAVDTWNAKVEEAIENLQDKYLNAINLIFQNLNNNITDGLGLEYVSEEWDLINQNADKYLDTINSLYETQALENKYLDAIDQTDNVSAQRQLKKLMDQEITALREKDKLTQYDIERANMKYEIALKQIALEEAQQNKSNMRLRRDSQGNYSYQFVADDEGIADAEQELSDLYNSLYNFDKENYQSNLDEIYSVWEEFQGKMAEAAQINDPEAREARELLLKEQYGELINGIVAENEVIRNNLYDSAFTDLADLYNVDVENFQQMADAEKEILMSDLLPYWDSGVQHMADAFAGEDGFLGVCKDAFAELDQATKDYEDGLIEIQDNAGQSFEEIKEGVDETIVSTEELVENNNELIESYNNELEAIDSVIDELDLLIEKYDKAAEAAKKATEEAYKYWQQENKDAADSAGDNKDSIGKDNENKGTNTNTNTNTPTNTSGNSGSNINSLGTASNGAPFIDSYTIKNGDTLSGIGARYGVAWRRIYEENKSTIGSNPNLIHAGKTLKIPKYDTGGYTGEWSGNSGQLAMLHEKELVLNANDTRNMLSAMEILREITLGSSIFSRLAAVGANASIVNGGFGDTLEQNVHIDASFPNVTNSHEIEDAINNLMNVATQRINRR